MTNKASEETLLRVSAVSNIAGALAAIVGDKNILLRMEKMRPYLTGHRFGEGNAVAVVRPGSLTELWHVLKVSVAANHIVIPQAANTGLTGGSTPCGTYDRPVIVISMMRIKGIHLLGRGEQVVCLPGTTLNELEAKLKPLRREPHSVIGSSCIGASVFGGICNNSGGALVQRGPAYTECALFARVDHDGALTLVNHLGLPLGEDPETILDCLERGDFASSEIRYDRAASARGYSESVRMIDEPLPARFNADPNYLFEASGSAGRIILFAVRLDTFVAEHSTTTFLIGTDHPRVLTNVRRHMLSRFAELPIMAEYIHRDAFGMADRYGRDMAAAVRWLGTSNIPRLFAVKAQVDLIAESFRWLPRSFGDRILQMVGRVLPNQVPPRIAHIGERFEHQLILQIGATGLTEAREYLFGELSFQDCDVIECSTKESQRLLLHRFVVAGAATRYARVHDKQVAGLVSLDVALRRNDAEWDVKGQTESILSQISYGHFFCHVFHHDYLVGKGRDVDVVKSDLLAAFAARGAEYPAEHNVGHQYRAGDVLKAHYRGLDPTNSCNPGIGQTSRRVNWAD